MKNVYVWHNTRGFADQFFVVSKKTDKVLFQIPKFLGRFLLLRSK